ncbi:hypothetical protein CC80DRAFT_299208 [Byssothecium circinans]|uniref:Uncharacterized protein n=1 Tax=Byssothecium circinans TaxID=147558 RepID=A0A6A5TD50_9PLEO|nr:hypothetical protein CC80DRAFT_299208 [Byssothecium circinans]
MSQYPSAPPPGAYVPPNQSSPPTPGSTPQQPQYGYQQPQTSSPYGSTGPGYGAPAPSHKPTNTFGQAFDQAVKQGKPMFNKLGKTISSKLGNKPSTPTPQHLESYNSYQQHQQHNQPPTYQAQNQQLNPQPQQQNAYPSPQQSPYNQSNYASPASGHSGQSNYFGQQEPPPPPSNAPPQSQGNAGYNLNAFGQGESVGQPGQGQYNQAQPQSPFSQTQAGLNSGQQTGVIGGSQAPAPPFINPSSPQHQDTLSQYGQQPQAQHQQWSAQNHSQASAHAVSPAPQQQPFSPASPLPNQQQHQWSPQQHQAPPTQQQPFNPTPPPQQFNAPPPIPVHPNQQQPPQQQWAPMSPVSPHAQAHSPVPPSVSPALPQQANAQQQPPPTAPAEPHRHSQPPTPAPQPEQLQAAPPTEFIAELPADLGNLSMENSNAQTPSSAPASSPYQAYRPSGTKSQSPGPGFTVPRRAVSMSSLPLADPWRFADPATELPTREFYILADLLYESIDRKFEPNNTGLLEASKILESWKAVGFAEDAAQLFAYNNYGAFAKLWSLEEIPHLMVPCQAALTPMWNFQPQSHSEAIKIPMGAVLANPISATYMPALNRAGWYKYFFLEMMHEPEGLEKMLTTLCSDTYKPGVLNQPDTQKRDRTVLPGVAAQAATIRNACVSSVSQETAALMQSARGAVQPQQPPPPQFATQVQPRTSTSTLVPQDGNAQAPMTDEERVAKMHSLKMQSQFNHMMATTMLGGGHTYGGPNYGGLV